MADATHTHDDTAADYRARAVHALTPEKGFHEPSKRQIDEATAWALLGISAAISETGGDEPTGITLRRSAIHHSA
jgi:hypothetical protein